MNLEIIDTVLLLFIYLFWVGENTYLVFSNHRINFLSFAAKNNQQKMLSIFSVK